MALLILEPIFHETIWGGTRLLELYDRPCPRLGHLYSVIGKKGQSNRILNGIHKGKSFLEVFLSIKHRYGMQDCEEFPLTIAIVDAEDHLSVQVHPDDKTAAVIEAGKRGKRESWYFISPPDEGEIISGCVTHTKLNVEEKIYSDQIGEIVKKVEYFFLLLEK